MHRCCDDFGECNQGRFCPARTFPLATGQGIKSPESAIDADSMCIPLSTTEAALIWLIVLACTGICLYLIVCFLQFIGV